MGAEKVLEVNARTERGTAEMKKSVVFLLMLVMAVAVLATACGGERLLPPVAPKSPWPYRADPGDLGPFVGMSLGRIGVLNTMYEFLLADETPVIAESFETNADGTSTVVKIRAGVKDSAGNAVTAADVAYSYTTGMAAGNLRPLGDIESVTATDDTTVEFKFKKALSGRDVEGILGEQPIVSKTAYEASADKFATKPVSTSAYVVTESVPGATITFEKNAAYWQTDAALQSPFAKQNVDKIIFQVIAEPAQHSIALETDAADISGSVSGTDVTRFEGNDKFARDQASRQPDPVLELQWY